MPDQKPSAGELLGQIAEFETTLNNLQSNLSALRNKITKNKEQYGEDVSKWPQM